MSISTEESRHWSNHNFSPTKLGNCATHLCRMIPLCAKIVPESNVFIPFGLAFERKQIPRFVGNVSSYVNDGVELLESSVVRPRQARYQAALRPDMKCRRNGL